MKSANFGPCVVAYGLTLCLAVAQSPTVLTPGTSTETVETISTGTRTTFSLTGNTILSWEQLNLASGSELVYDFISGDRVLNLLSGSSRHRLDGTVTSNGIVAFFSPNANFDMNGSITAKGVVLSALNVDSNEFFGDNGYTLNGGSGTNTRVLIGGNIKATDGNVVIAGPRVSINGDGNVEASNGVLIGGGSDIRVAGSGQRKMRVDSESGNVLNLGVVKGSVIEMISGGFVSNEGVIDAGEGQVFIEVGQDMQITNEPNGMIIADEVFSNAPITGGVVIVPDEGDSAPAVSEGTLNVPTLIRPDGVIVSVKRKVSANAPVSASGDSGRDIGKKNAGGRGASGSGEVAANRQGSSSLLQRSSFFGVRGGSKTVSSR